MSFGFLLSLCLVVSYAVANPIQFRSSPVTLPIAAKLNATGGARALINRDRARFQALYARGQAKSRGQDLVNVPVPVTDAASLYTADVGVGASTYTLIVDTGSSNTWVGAQSPYAPGPNSIKTGEEVAVSYGSGSFQGEEFTDDVTIGSTTITGQSIGAANSSTGFNGFDGILGLGPNDLTTVTTPSGEVIPTVTDNLVSQGLVSAALVGVSFVPSTTKGDQNGELAFGAPDTSKFTGEISFVPITTTSPASYYWGIDQSITYGSSESAIPILSSTAGFVDTGTTLLYIASDAFEAYQQATGATVDQATGLLTIESADSLQSLFFNVGNTTFEFTANAQIWPQALNAQLGDANDTIYLVVNNIGTPTGSGVDFINGFAFLQRFYAVFDTDNSQVGFATTNHTQDTTN
ncbi:aspartic proteinase [Ramaria rubella]|nr:aspartic proteinase [Ramaria rubella]